MAANDGVSSLIEHIAHLSLRDIDGILSRRAVLRDSSLSDEDLALSLFLQEAGGLLHVAREYASRGAPSDVVIQELRRVEHTARHDRVMALALSEGRDPPQHRPAWTVDLPSHRRRGIYVDVPSRPENTLSQYREMERVRSLMRQTSNSPRPESYPRASQSSTNARNVTRRPLPTPPTSCRVSVYPAFKCTICGDEIRDGPTIRTDCDHFLDLGCLRTMFENATRDESLFPPKCCQNPIKLEDIRHYLDFPLVERFRYKSREFLTKDRVYCHNKRCSTFLGAATPTPSSLACTDCGAETCSSCKDAAHGDKTCKDRLAGAVLDLAKQQGWQRCPSCRHLVDRTEGCNHMTCLCGVQFCYVCAAQWKTCDCPQFADLFGQVGQDGDDVWDADRLLRPFPLPLPARQRPPPAPVPRMGAGNEDGMFMFRSLRRPRGAPFRYYVP